MRGHTRVLIPLFAGAILAGGCASKPTTITGEVNLDGKPIKAGRISFLPDDSKMANVEGAIKDGKYSVTASPGSWRVKISSPVVVGKRRVYEDDPASPLREDFKEGVPDEYNTVTKLTADVKKGENTLNFDLKRKKKE